MTTVLEALPYRVLHHGSNTIEWLKARQQGVGASESPAVLGDSAWGTAISVAKQKWSDEVVDVTTDLMEFGHLAEPLIVAFMLNHPERFGHIGEIVEAEGLLQSIEWPWLLGTLDREVITTDAFGNTIKVPLELKSINDFVASEWRDGGDDNDEDESGGYGDKRYFVPKKYQVQVQQQMAVTGAPFGFVAAWLGKGQVVLIRLERDEEYIQEYLVGKVGDFWHYFVETHTLPPLSLNDKLWDIYPGDLTAKAMEADEDLIDDIGKWRVATTDARELKVEIKQLKFNITDRMGDVCYVVDPVTKKVIHSLKPQNTARGCDFDKLQLIYPDAYENCVKPAGRTRAHRATKEPVG